MVNQNRVGGRDCTGQVGERHTLPDPGRSRAVHKGGSGGMADLGRRAGGELVEDETFRVTKV